MQRLRIMAASCCLQQVATASFSRSSVLAVPKVVGLRTSSGSPSVFLRPWWSRNCGIPLTASSARPGPRGGFGVSRAFSSAVQTEDAAAGESSSESAGNVTTVDDVPTPLKTKKLTKQVKHIMNILNTEAVEAASKDKVIPTLRPGDVLQLRVEVPENKRRVSLLRGIVIAVHNAGINSTFRIRRVLAGVGVELIFPLYSPNIKEMKVVDKRRARRAKLYYLRDKVARLSSC